jgi:hypothetical protein
LGLVDVGLLGQRLETLRSSSGLGFLRSLSHRKIDTAASHLGLGVLVRHKIQVLLSNLQPSVGSDDISILNVLFIQSAEAPVRVLGLLLVLELCDLAEDGHLLDQTLQSPDVNREGRIIRVALNSSLLILAEFLNPNGHHLLKLRTSEEAERGVLAGSLVTRVTNLLLKTVTEGLTEIREFLLISKGAQGSHHLLPVGKVSIMNDIPEVLADDGGQQAHVVGTTGLLGEVVLLRLLNALLATTDGNHEGIRHAVLSQGHIKGLFKLAEKQSTGDLLLCLALGAVEDLERVVGLSALRCGQFRQEIVTVGGSIEHGLQPLVLLGT